MVLLFCEYLYSHVHEVNPLLIINAFYVACKSICTQLHFFTQQKSTCKQLQFLLNTSICTGSDPTSLQYTVSVQYMQRLEVRMCL